MNNAEKIKLIRQIVKDNGLSGMLNLLKHKYDLTFKNNKVLAHPVSLQLEPTSLCNLRCKMCKHSFDKKSMNKVLKLDQFKNILDQLPFLKNLTLQGLGEPLLNPDIFMMIKEAKKRNIRVGFTTNATLLTEDNGGKIIDSGLDWMFISLDAMDKQKYESIRIGANYETVISNIKLFFETKGDRLPKTNFWALIMEENLNEIPRIVKFANELGMEKVVLQSLHDWGHQNFRQDINKIKAGEEKLSELVNNIKKVSGPLVVELHSTIKESENKKCDWPWRSLYITADGYVTPCCMQGSDPEIINFGNIFEENISEILNNNKYQEFRNKLKNKPIPKICVNCPAYYKQKVIKI